MKISLTLAATLLTSIPACLFGTSYSMTRLTSLLMSNSFSWEDLIIKEYFVLMKAPTLGNIIASDTNLHIFILVLVNVNLCLWVIWENSISVSVKLERIPGPGGELLPPSPADCPSPPLCQDAHLFWPPHDSPGPGSTFGLVYMTTGSSRHS